jgi:hypothetical protein
MKIAIIAVAIALTSVVPARAANADVPADHDATPVPFCNQMPASAVIEVFSKTEAEGICHAMGLLDGVRVEDIREFSKASYVLSRWGYDGTRADITRQLVEIMRLRGLYNKPERWHPNLDIITGMYSAFNGVISPLDAIASLRGSGESTKSLDGVGFGMTLIALLEQKRQVATAKP